VLYLIMAIWSSQLIFGFIALYVFIGAQRELRGVMATGRVYNPAARNIYASSLGMRDDWSEEALRGYGQPGSKPGFFKRLVTNWRLRRLARETERREKMKAEVDRILEKVSKEGMPSLTAKERRTLKEASNEYRKS
jgi:hypothetical protein